jgi:photosystem II stability/assembly factor-like uncharacterized protein
MKKQLLFSALTALVLPLTSMAQWQHTYGPEGGLVKTMIADADGNIYTGAERGIFKSTDDGQSWRTANNGLSASFEPFIMDTMGTAVLVSGNSLNAHELYITEDNGATWQNIAPQDPLLYISGLGSIGNRILFSASSGIVAFKGIQYSDDMGATWDTIPTYLISPDSTPQPQVNFMTVIGEDIYAYVNNSGLYRTSDMGATWEHADNGYISSGNPPRFLGRLGTTLFLCEEFNGTYHYSTDNAASWQTASIDPFIQIRQFVLHNGSIYAPTNDRTYRSTDGITNWTQMTNLGTGNHTLLHSHGNVLLHATHVFGEGIRRTTDNGANWSPSQTGFAATRAQTLHWHQGEFFAASYERGMQRSSDNGASWVRIQPSPVPALLYATDIITIGNEVLQAGYSRIFRSTDLGASWTSYASGLPGIFNANDLELSGNDLYVACTEGLYKSTSFGQWASISANLPGVGFHQVIKRNGRLFAVGSETVGWELHARVVYSDDEGATWTNVSAQFNFSTYSEAKAVHAVGGNILVAADGDLWLSSDNGATFSNTTADISYISGAEFHTEGDNTFLASGSGLWVSGNNGQNWENITGDLFYTGILSVTTQNDQLYVGTDWGGVWTRELNTIVVGTNEQPIATTGISVWPNPANDQLWFVADGMEGGTVELIDLAGRTVRSQAIASGRQQMSTHDLPVGIYTLRSIAPSGMRTAKVVVNH